MDLEEVIINDQAFRLVKRSRRGEVAIYTSGELYARVGEREPVEKMMELHAKFDGLGFPVAAIAGRGEINAGTYYLEESLGEKRFSELFRDDMEMYGFISPELFESFLLVSEKFARAQFGSAVSTTEGLSLIDIIRPSDLADELPEVGEQLLKRFEEAVSVLKVFPSVLTQGDFNPHNLFPQGVIDFEKIYYAPCGYDLVTNICHINQFPESHEYEYYRGYFFSKDQEDSYYKRFDAIYVEAGLPKLSDYKGYFEYCRAIWSAARNHRAPKLQQWRYELFKKQYFS
ncbi:MAG: hypothetical protein Q7S86_03265 [bacterium]|nr:hypothetical protein [bacterium]